MAFALPCLPARLLDANGDVLAGAKMYVYQAGTSTPANFYTTAALSVVHPNPLVADSGGLFANSFFSAGDYKLTFTTSAGVTILEIDNFHIEQEGTTIDFPTSVKTSNFSVSASDRANVFLVDASGGTVTVSADSATLNSGFPFFVVNTGATGTITVSGVSAQTIDGAASKNLTSQYAAAGFVSIGAAGWQTVMSSNLGSFVTPVEFLNEVDFGTGSYIVGGPLVAPGGRLTLTSATPVLTSDVTGATTLYYSPYVHNRIALYNGTGWTIEAFSELSQALSDASKSPAAAASDSNYDMFVWNDSGTLRCTRGPAWSSATARGTGAGTTELELLHGVFVNKIAITNGPAAQRGVYVGTIRTNGSTATPMVWKPAAASGGAACTLYVWNNYNRVRFTAVSRDNKDTWNYATGSFRSTDNSTNNRVHIVRGLQVDDAEVMAVGSAGNDLNIRLMVGLGLDSASHHSDAVVGCGCPVDVNEPVSMIAHYRGDPGLGFHYFQALEWGGGSGTTTWRGDNGLEQMQGLFVSVWA